MALGSKIKRSQLRLASLFQKPPIIPSDLLFEFESILKCHTQRMETIEFPDAELYAKPFEKRCIKKKNQIF